MTHVTCFVSIFGGCIAIFISIFIPLGNTLNHLYYIPPGGQHAPDSAPLWPAGGWSGQTVPDHRGPRLPKPLLPYQPAGPPQPLLPWFSAGVRVARCPHPATGPNARLLPWRESPLAFNLSTLNQAAFNSLPTVNNIHPELTISTHNQPYLP